MQSIRASKSLAARPRAIANVIAALAVAATLGTIGCATPRADLDAGAIDVPGVDAPPCPTGLTLCGDQCSQLAIDPTHCGACGTICALGQVCSNGACSLLCAGGTVRCGSSCVDPNTNPAHCGATDPCTGSSVGMSCAPGQVCFNGRCQITCGPGFIFCNGRCVDPQHDALSCGASGDCTGANAGTMCAAGQACTGGVCQLTCPGGQINCGGTCVDPATNRRFCGAHDDCMATRAGSACAAGQVCSNGACQVSCPTDHIACGGNCIDPTTDRTYCGASMDCAGANAGSACAAGQICVGGTCQTSCSAGQAVCGGACVDPMTSRQYCGARGDCTAANAGSVCGAGQICASGACQAIPCPAGQLVCGGGCIDPTLSPQFCGATSDCMGANAGTACRFDSSCIGGHCVGSFARYSYLSPGTISGAVQTRARPTRYSIGGAFPSTIYYTLDGSLPSPGMAGTRSSQNVVDLGVLNEGAHVRWYADFGPAWGVEPIVQSLTFHVNAGGQHSHAQIVENVRFMGGNGPVIVVAPGATVTGAVSYEYWHSDPSGYCFGCSVNMGLWLAGQASFQGCMQVVAQYPGTSGSEPFTFTAPSAPGRYGLFSSLALDFHCVPGGEEIGEVFVY